MSASVETSPRSPAAVTSPRRWSAGKRTPNDVVDVGGLCMALDDFAALKKPPFPDWEFAQYAKSRRSQGPDREGIALYKPLLAVIVRFAPRGFPGHVALRDVWLHMNRKHGIKEGDEDSAVWASKCADMVRLACKHLTDLKASGTRYVTPDVAELLDALDPSGGSRDSLAAIADSPAVPPPPPAVPPQPPRTLKEQVSNVSATSSVQFCVAICKCPLCQVPDVISDEDKASEAKDPEPEQDVDMASEGSREAEANCEAAPVGRLRKVMKKPAAASPKHTAKKPAGAPRGPSISVVQRHSPPQKRGAYIMANGSFVVKCSAKRSKDYAALIAELAEAMREGHVVGKAAAVAWLDGKC